MKYVFRFVNYLIAQTKIVSEIIKAIKLHTDAIKDLTKASIELTKLEIENRKLINEALNVQDDIIAIINQKNALNNKDKNYFIYATQTSDKKKDLN